MLVMGQQVLNSQISWADKLVIAQQPQITQIFLVITLVSATNADHQISWVIKLGEMR
jgi:hypothetical protein